MNNPLDSLLEGWAARLGPMAQQAGNTAVSYAERVLARLDMIHAAVQSEEWEERAWSLPLSLAANVPTEYGEVRPGHEWLLTGVGCLGAGTVTVNANGLARFTKQFTTADTIYPVGTMLHGGESITAVITGNAAPVRVFLQFKERVRVSTRSRYAGQPELPVDPRDMKGRQDHEGRHGR